MGLFKFQNWSAYRNVQDNPRVLAVATTVPGNVFAIKDGVTVGNVAREDVQVLFADATAAQGDVWVCSNIVDKPEVRNYADYNIAPGEYFRAFKLNNLKDELVELSGDLVIDSGALPPAKGVKLVPTVAGDTDLMVWKTAADVTGYDVYLEIMEVTTFGGFTIDGTQVAKGYTAKIK